MLESALVDLGVDVVPIESGTLDGGDVLFTGRELFVGLSSRTNEEGARALGTIFPHVPLHTIRVAGALHLKSVATALDAKTLLVAQSLPIHGYELVRVPDPICANVVTAGDAVLAQAGFPASEAIIRARAGDKHLVTLVMSELAKADAALTCCSVLV